MATRTALKIKEAFVQYSKKMCTRVTIFWMVYRIAIALLIFFKPETSASYIKLTEGVDTVMIANISVYTTNSVSEKLGIAWVKRHQNESKDDDSNETNLEDEGVNG